MTPQEDLKLEQYIHRTLRTQPDRPAPRTLESRVLAAIAERQARPWWRQSFAHWPLAARVPFLAVAAALAVVLTRLGVTGSADLLPVLRESLAPLASVRDTVAALGDATLTVGRSIPTLWLYGAVALLGALYAAFFGLGATAYRALVLNR